MGRVKEARPRKKSKASQPRSRTVNSTAESSGSGATAATSQGPGPADRSLRIAKLHLNLLPSRLDVFPRALTHLALRSFRSLTSFSRNPPWSSGTSTRQLRAEAAADALQARAADGWERYQLTGDIALLEEAIVADEGLLAMARQRDAVYWDRKHNLGVCLLDRYGEKGNARDLERALECFEGAVRAAVEDAGAGVSVDGDQDDDDASEGGIPLCGANPNLARYRINFGKALRCAYDASLSSGHRDRAQLDAAIHQFEAAFILAPSSSLLSDVCRGYLSQTLLHRAEVLGRGTCVDGEDASGDEAASDRARALLIMRGSLGTEQGLEKSALGGREGRRVDHALSTDSGINIPSTISDLTGSVHKLAEYPLGSGGYADVYKCEWRKGLEGPQKVAVKVIRATLGQSSDPAFSAQITKRICFEIENWHTLCHPNVIPLLGVAHDFGPYTAMVSPWASEYNLTQYLTKHGPDLSTLRRLQLMQHVAAGLKYLHQNSIVHGDLSGPNVLINDAGHAMLTDFGLSVAAGEVLPMSISSTVGGSVRYAAPELYFFSSDRSAAAHNSDEGDGADSGDEARSEISARVTVWSDVYSFGAVVLEILSGKVPYHYLHNDGEVIISLSKGIQPRRPEGAADEHWELVERCWVSPPSDRPSMESLLKRLDEVNDKIVVS